MPATHPLQWVIWRDGCDPSTTEGPVVATHCSTAAPPTALHTTATLHRSQDLGAPCALCRPRRRTTLGGVAPETRSAGDGMEMATATSDAREQGKVRVLGTLFVFRPTQPGKAWQDINAVSPPSLFSSLFHLYLLLFKRVAELSFLPEPVSCS